MRKVTLRMNEQEKYEVIKNLVEKKGNKAIASIKLNCSLRTIKRLINKYKTKGKNGFIHGNRNLKPSITISDDIKKQIIELYNSHEYNTSNFTHFRELLLNNKNIKVSYSFVHKLLSKTGISSPKCHRITKKRKAKAEREKQKMLNLKTTENQLTEQTSEGSTTTPVITESSRIIPNSLAHPRKPRAKYFGEQIQMDASDHRWINDEKWHLHIAVDDSTSAILAAYFTPEETLIGYYHVMQQILTKYGIPYAIKTDNRIGL